MNFFAVALAACNDPTIDAYKPYPCGVVLNPVIEACLALQARAGFDPAEIQSIKVTGHPLLRQRTDRPAVLTGRESQVSAQHAVAIALSTGRAGLEEFSDAAVQRGVPHLDARRVTHFFSIGYLE